MRTRIAPKPPSRTRCKKLLAPVDFSEPSLHAVRHAAALAAEWRSQLVLLHVVEPFEVDWKMNMTSLRRQARELATQRLNQVLKTGLPPAVRASAKTVSGDPVSSITQFARRSGVDLIVIATHGRTGLQHFRLGSVAERVVRLAPCAVLVVR